MRHLAPFRQRLAAVVLGMLASTTAAMADSFGAGGNQITIDFVTVPAATNPVSGYGIVNSDYRMGKYEITKAQWEKFSASLGVSVTGDPWYAYEASAFFAGANVPANNISWYQAAQFVNWLNTSTGHHAAYKFTGVQGTSNYTFGTWSTAEAAGATNLYRHKDAYYFLPSEDEWVKAAYWNGAALQTHATQAGASLAQGTGTGATGWNYYSNGYATTAPGPWPVGSSRQELNGTYDMMGNAWEWLESPNTGGDYGAGAARGLRGGSFSQEPDAVASAARGSSLSVPLNGDPATGGDYDIGFRVASIVPPNTLAWTGSVDGNWDINTTANFSGGASGKYTDGNLAVFDDSGTNTTITVTPGGVTPNGVAFSNSTKGYTLAGGPLKGSGGLLVSGGGLVTLNSANTYTGGTTVAAGTLLLGNQAAVPDDTAITISGGTLDLGGFTKTSTAVSFQGGLTLNGVIVNNGAAFDGQAGTVAAALQGSAGMSKTGGGTLVLSGTNTYAGATVISAGILSAGNIEVSGGSSNLGNATSPVVLGDASSQGTLAYTGGAATYTRGFTINAGGGQLTNAGSGLLTVSTGGITLGGVFSVGGATQNISIFSVMSSTGGLTKTGADTVILAGSNTYGGATSVTAGILKAGIASVANISGAFGNNSAVILANATGVSLDITGYDTQIGSLAGGGGNGGNVSLGGNTLTVGGNNANTTYSGVIASSAGVPGVSLRKIGSGELYLNRASTYTGKTVIDGGTLHAYGAPNSVLGTVPSAFQADNITLNNGGTLYLEGSGDNSGNLSVNRGIYLGAGTQQVENGYFDQAINGVISGPGGLTKLNSGNQYQFMWLNGANTYTGDTKTYAGELNIGQYSLQNSAYDPSGGGQLNWPGGAVVFGGLTSGTHVVVPTGVTSLTLNPTLVGVTKTYTGNLTGGSASPAMTLTKTGAGTQVLGGTNTYTGLTTVSGGKLTISSSGTINSSSGVSIGAGEFNYNSATTLVPGITFSNSGGILSGTGIMGASTTIAGIHAPGNNGVGIQKFSNSLAYAANSSLHWQLNAESAGSRGTDFNGVDIGGGTFSITSLATLDLSFGGAVDFRSTFWNSAHNWTVVDLLSSFSGSGGTDIFTLAALSGANNYTAAQGSFRVDRVSDGSHNDVVLTWKSPYDIWASAPIDGLGSGNNGLTDNPDNDAGNNLTEYAFNTHPLNGASGPIKYVAGTPGSITAYGTPTIAITQQSSPIANAVFGRRVDREAAGLSYTVQFSADLSEWVDNAVSPTVVAADAVVEVVSVQFPATITVAGGGTPVPKFFKVKVEKN